MIRVMILGVRAAQVGSRSSKKSGSLRIEPSRHFLKEVAISGVLLL